MTPAASRSRRRHVRPLLAVVAVGLLAACAVAEASTGAPDDLATVAATPTETPAAEPTPPLPQPSLHVGPRLDVALRSAAAWDGKATYQLVHQAGRADVTVTRLGDKVRVDVASGGGTSTLMTADVGAVACQATDRTTCVLAAPPGAPLPPAFDTGLGGLLFTSLPALTQPGSGLTDGGWLAAGRDAAGQELAAAACADVVAPKHVDQYCVTEAGLLVRARLEAGTLTLVTSSPDVDPAVFAPPVPAVPLA